MHACDPPPAGEERQLQSDCGRSPELADIFGLYGSDYRRNNRLPSAHRKVMWLIERCRTSALGGHLFVCDHCGHEHSTWNSCCNRHCPKCQTLNKERWLADRKAELLSVGYFHVVFTLPHELNPLVLCNKRVMLNILFAAVGQTLLTMGSDPQWRLNGQLGFLAVLHTWSQQLMDHFHLHCVIPAGALSRDRTRWTHARKNYLFRIASAAKLFRAKYLCLLQTAFSEGALIFPGRAAAFREAAAFGALIGSVRKKEWIAFAKTPFAGPEQVLEYLGRYTHRVAISNYRIKAIADGRVRFTYRDRDDDDKIKEMTLDADEFIRRFLLHILPEGFMRIRHFGFLSNRYKARNLGIIRALIGQPSAEKQPRKTPVELVQEWMGVDITRCPRCHIGTLRRQERLPPSHHEHDPPPCTVPGDNP